MSNAEQAPVALDTVAIPTITFFRAPFAGGSFASLNRRDL
jgi:hypothetical protein